MRTRAALVARRIDQYYGKAAKTVFVRETDKPSVAYVSSNNMSM